MIKQYASSWGEGLSSEATFRDLAMKRGFTVFGATKNQNIYDHIDFFLEFKGRRFSVDVKAMKRVQRHSNKRNGDALWIEFQNVIGNKGWIHGKQDFIAFEFEDRFVLVKRHELLGYAVASLDSFDERVNSPHNALYKLYQRKGRSDLITLIEKDSIYLLDNKVWIKNQNNEKLH
ncbi:hypothetical protein LMH73_025800 [Vibrio splendidus]|nr:hypothetical protein [Vibrio splendidus]MCC4880689.1 hypothetical protein [Vibrio splendidus]